jgi:hypothetical protein
MLSADPAAKQLIELLPERDLLERYACVVYPTREHLPKRAARSRISNR